MSIEWVIPSNHFILCHLLHLLPSVFPASGSFPMSQLFTSGGQSIGASASASVLPLNIQDWFPLGLTGWISLLSKGLSRVFPPAPQFESISSSALCFLYCPAPTSVYDYCYTMALIIRTFVSNVKSLLFNTVSGLSKLFFQGAVVFWLHGCSHHLQWF